MVSRSLARFSAVIGSLFIGASFAFSQGIGPGSIGKNVLEQKFVENKGQWDSSALFLSRQPGMDYWVTNEGIKVDLYSYEKKPGGGGPVEFEGGLNGRSSEIFRKGTVINFKFNGAGRTAEPFGTSPAKSKLDFLVGPAARHATDVNVFGEATVRNLKPGVNLRNYFDGTASRYDIIVRPGTDARLVSFDVSGGHRVFVDKGDLIIHTASGRLTQSGVFAYQMVGNAQKIVSAKFKMLGARTVGFELGNYNPKLPLVIDPLVYGTYIGSTSTFFSSGYELVNGIHADSQGNVYITGETDSITFPVTDGPYGFSLVGGLDSYLIRLQGDAYDTTYVAYLGGSSDDSGSRIAYESVSGALWIVGETDSIDFPGVVGGAPTGNGDVFLAKFNVANTGAITPDESFYYTNVGQNANHLLDIAMNGDGTFYVSGRTLAPGGSFLPYLPGATVGSADGFVTKFDAGGAVLWERLIGSSVFDSAGRIGSDSSGNVVFTGAFTFFGTQDTATDPSPVFSTTAGVYPEGRLMRNGDIFVVKLNSSGTTVFASLLGGSNLETTYGATFDDIGNIYVVGATGSFDFPRNEGAFDETPAGSITATKISASGAQLFYSTGLSTTGNTYVRGVRVDKNGSLVIGGVADWSINPTATPTVAAAAIPSTIPIVGGLDGVYSDGANGTLSNGLPPLGGCPPTTDGTIIVLNAAGTNIVYSDYIGQNTDDAVSDVFVDSTGAIWIAGNESIVICNTVPPSLKPEPWGITPYLTGNAAKLAVGANDGFLIKLRVGQPIINAVTLAPLTVGAGLGATSLATVFLRDPAPVGGVTLTATLSNATATSFAATPGTIQTTLFIAQGQTFAQKTIFSLPITTVQTSDFRVTLQNDFVLARLTIKPWLDSFSVSPATLIGGNGLTLTSTLPQAAPQTINVTLSTDRPDLITLPNPSQMAVPTGASFASIIVPTVGVESEQDFTVFAALLGVTKSSSGKLIPATISTLSFNPPTVNGGSISTGTVAFSGKVGAGRSVTISYVSGVAGTLINGNPLPVVLAVPDQASALTFTVTAPPSIASSSVTMNATDGTTGADGTLFIDNIDISDFIITPSLDVTGGTVLVGQVVLTNQAGPGGFTVNIGSSNTAAIELGFSTITIPTGALTSATFNIPTKVIPADLTSIVSVSKAGFTTRSRTVTVRGIGFTLTLNPGSVIGGTASAGTVTSTLAAPAGGFVTALGTSLPAFSSVPASVTIAAGQTSATFNVTTASTNIVRSATITATVSATVSDNKLLTINPPTITGLSFAPSTFTGPGSSTGTVTVSNAAPAGGLTIVINHNGGVPITAPPTVVIPQGAVNANFTVLSTSVASDLTVTFTATLGSSSDSEDLLVRAPSISGITFTPPKIQGGGIAAGTVTLSAVAPIGGLTINVASLNTTFATIIGPTMLTVPAGSRTAVFTVQSVRVSRLIAVQFQASISGSSQTLSGFLWIKP